MDNKSYFEQIDDIRNAFDDGLVYEMLVINSSMSPMFKAYKTKVKLVPLKEHKLQYGSIVLYSRMSQSISIRWVKWIRPYTIDVRGVMQSHSEKKIPYSSIIGVVSEFTYKDQWVKRDSLKGLQITCWYTILSFAYRCIRPIKDLVLNR